MPHAMRDPAQAEAARRPHPLHDPRAAAPQRPAPVEAARATMGFFKKSDLKKSYELGDDLGTGNFAVVKRAKHKKKKGDEGSEIPDEVAVKIIDKAKVEDMNDIQARAFLPPPRAGWRGGRPRLHTTSWHLCVSVRSRMACMQPRGSHPRLPRRLQVGPRRSSIENSRLRGYRVW